MNLGLAVSAEITRLPSFRAVSLSGGNCSLRFTSADWAPAVERPSSQSHVSMMRRKSATSSLLNTSGTQISIVPQSVPRRDLHRHGAARSFLNERQRALVERGVVQLVEDVVDEHFHLPVLVDLGFRKRIEAPEARQHGALVRGKQGSAVNLGIVEGETTDLPRVVDLILVEQAERLVRDVGERQTHVGRIE